MRAWCLLLILTCTALAQETPHPESPPPEDTSRAEVRLLDGVATHAFWEFRFTADGLALDTLPPPPGRVFSGRDGQGIRIRIDVIESAKHAAPETYAAADMDGWRAEQRSMEDSKEMEGPGYQITFVERDGEGYSRTQGYAWHRRGAQCFRVHAGLEGADGAGRERVRKALAGFEPGEDNGRCMFVLQMARATGFGYDDPRILLPAAQAYQAGRFGSLIKLDGKLPALTEKLGLRILQDPKGLNNVQQLQVREMLGYAQLEQNKIDAGTATLEQAVKFAGDRGLLEKSRHNPVYNLACAYARGSRTKDAFDMLKRYFSKIKGQHLTDMLAHAKQDPDLVSLRDQPEWEELLNKYGKPPAPAPAEGDGEKGAEEAPPEGHGEE